MDLRRSVLTKSKSNSNLNFSTISAYESAVDDSSDSSLYYSFSNDTGKSIDLSKIDDTSTVSTEDKENTVIENVSGIYKKIPEILITNASDTMNSTFDIQESVRDEPMSIDIEEKIESENAVSDDVVIIEDDNMNTNPDLPLDNPVITILDESDSVVITDPNANLVNPFVSMTTSSPVVKKSKKRSSVISTQAYYFSPIVRRSIDTKKPVNIVKPIPTRRTIFDAKPSTSKVAAKPPVPKPREKSLLPCPSTSKVPPVKVPVKAPTKAQIKPKPIPKKVVEPPKVVKVDPKPPAKRKSSPRVVQTKVPKLSQVTTQPCKYCGKKFKENAFLHHWAENCTQIPIAEKRKMLGKRENVEVQKRRTTIFLAPPPKLNKSQANKSLNKSGIKITPKKSLRCHICKAVVHDAFTFAKHVLAHKFEREKREEEKQEQTQE